MRKLGSTVLAIALNFKKVFLSEIEIKELKNQKSLSEIRNRFVYLNIPISSIIALNLGNYLRLKVYLAIYISLSRRRQQPYR